MSRHTFQKHERAVNVVVVIRERNFNAFAHGFKSREVNNTVNVVFLEDLIHSRSVANVRIVEFRHNAGDLFNSVQTFLAGVYEIIHDHDVVIAVDEFYHGMRADIARSACNKYAFH